MMVIDVLDGNSETLRSSAKQVDTEAFSVCYPEERRVSLSHSSHLMSSHLL